MNYIHPYNSPLGKITLASDGSNIIGLWFDGQKYFPDKLREYEENELPIFELTAKWLDIYFSGNIPDFMPPIKINSTPFRKTVWGILQTIPYGKTITYGEIAKEIAKQKGLSKMSAQAIGGAISHNLVSLIIPCHRVIGANGNLTGYAGGIERKIKLLELEGVNLMATHTMKKNKI